MCEGINRPNTCEVNCDRDFRMIRRVGIAQKNRIRPCTEIRAAQPKHARNCIKTDKSKVASIETVALPSFLSEVATLLFPISLRQCQSQKRKKRQKEREKKIQSQPSLETRNSGALFEGMSLTFTSLCNPKRVIQKAFVKRGKGKPLQKEEKGDREHISWDQKMG